MNNTKTFAYAIVLCVGLAQARAHAQAFDSQQLRLVPNQQDNYFGLHSARILGSGAWEAGLVLNYANDPLVIVDDDGERAASIVRDLAVADAMFAIGLFDRLELGLDLPVILLQDGDELPPETGLTSPSSSVGIGDIHVMAKLSLFNGDTQESPGGPGLALAIDAQLPTGESSDFRGEGLRIEPRAILDYAFPRSLRLSFQVGYLVRPQAELLDAEVDDSLTFGLGADLPLDKKQRWHVIGETDAEISVLASEVDAVEVPVELLLGGRYIDDSGVMVEAGGGFGLVTGFGTPDYRLLLGVSYRSPNDPDPDHDGLLNDADQCPDDPEDRDDFEDDDGCPDPDNDKDGVLDTADACRDDAEDVDTFEDENGCPDPDNDGDNIMDVDDGCPLEAEDRDGFEDANGCPDPDNDKDGLLDAKDECPNEAEDFDGFEDENGCPEQGSGLVKLTCDKIDIADRVYFDTGSDRIQPRSFGLLEQVASVLKSASYVKKMRVEGHTDDRGKDTANLDLSSRRAASVLRFLTEHGVTAERLTSEGFGETVPIADNKTNTGRAQNRRVEFVILEQDSRCAK